MSIYFHIDLNSFFVSCERIKNPALIGKPIVVGGMGRRGIVSTASYEARAYGIHSAMPMFQAKELCKDLIIVGVDMTYYRQKSKEFFQIVESYSSQIEIASIDECYMDVTEIIPQYGDVITLAKVLQNEVLEKLQLGCSIGIANNMFLAKMASDMKKPLGITVLNSINIQYYLWPLDIGEMHGIGKSSTKKLHELNINTIADLANEKNLEVIKQVLGKSSYIYFKRSNGQDYRKIDTNHDTFKSIGNSTTLEKDTRDEEEIKETLMKLANSVSLRAINKNVVSDHITITIKYTREKSVTKNLHIEEATNDADTIYQYATMLFDAIYNNEPVRLLGISLNHVMNINELTKQLSIFNYQEDQIVSKKAEEKMVSNKEDLVEDLKKKLNLGVLSDLLKEE